MASFFTANAQETVTLTHNENPDEAAAGGSVGCPTAGATNTFSRSFVLEDFDIDGEFEVQKVVFFLQDYVAGNDVTVRLSTTSEAYPGGYPDSLTELAEETVTFDEDGDFQQVEVEIAATVPAGSELVVEIEGADFFTGGNEDGQTAPSFLMAEACGAPEPIDVAELDFDTVAYVINVVGTADTGAGVNEALASKLSVFPNPANNVINIANAENILVNGVVIADLNGRTVKNAKFDGVAEASVNIADLAAGVYMMTISSDKGTATKKIVKN